MKRKKAVRQSIVLSVLLMAALFLLPLAVITPFRPALFDHKAPEQEDVLFTSGDWDAQTVLKVLDGEQVTQMDLGTYLVAVVRAEMPASFELEALKAQAAAARTYTLYQMQSGGHHGDTADVCTDSTCCQAYIGKEAAYANWGDDAAAYEEKIETAVKETDGQVILCDGEPILAVFHSSSAGLTRAAGAVWVNDLPYLQAVESPEMTDRIPNYYSQESFTAEEFREAFLRAHPDADLSGGINEWLKRPVVDEAGSVETVEVGGITVKGSQLRSILGLRSACFDWEVKDGKLVFYVTGYGHGVGLSQYGANKMAQEGADYRAIVTHYYTGVTIGIPDRS